MAIRYGDPEYDTIEQGLKDIINYINNNWTDEVGRIFPVNEETVSEVVITLLSNLKYLKHIEYYDTEKY